MRAARQDFGQLGNQLQADPAAFLCGIVSQADTSGNTCDVIKKAFPKKRGATFGDAARSVPQDRFDQTLGGLVEARR